MRGVWLFLLALTLPLAAAAHDAPPVFVEIEEAGGGNVAVQWKVPTTVPRMAIPTVTMPESCAAQNEAVTVEFPDAYLSRITYNCTEPLFGKEIGLFYPLHNPSLSTLYRAQLATGETFTRVLKPEEQVWTLPDEQTAWSVAHDYTLLGIEHIVFAIDHIFFVLGLLLLVRGTRTLIKTITAFTVAHSITLALAALGLVTVPAAPVEAVIALSIVFVALELSRQQQGIDGFAQRSPWVVAFSFGLLHGFGFAGTLAGVGLPQGEIPVALLFFNVGVELGQLGFVAAALILLAALRTLSIRWPQWSLQLPAYTIGSVSAFWFIDRCVKMFG